MPSCRPDKCARVLTDPSVLCLRMRLQAQSLLKNLHDFYTDGQKYGFVHSFNHAQSEFDFKRMLDSMGHDTSALPQ